MFSRLFLFYIVFISCYFNISLAHETKQNDDLLLQLKLKDYDIKFAEMEKLIEHQNVRFAKMEKHIEHQNVRFAEQDMEIAEQKTLITEQNTKLCEIKSHIEILERTKTSVTAQSPIFSNDTGVVFTRWGRSDCPRSTSTQVYNGTTGGGHYTLEGTSVNYVCMSHEPLYNVNKHYSGGLWDNLYGAEYQGGPRSGFLNYEVPCAVCRAAPYSTKLMIPGRNKCYPGWVEAYTGELRSGHYNHKAASEYICLDEQAKHTGNINKNNGKLLFPVKAICGSLPCPPYESSTLVTCVVCIK